MPESDPSGSGPCVGAFFDLDSTVSTRTSSRRFLARVGRQAFLLSGGARALY
jgi:hypothetical protein